MCLRVIHGLVSNLLMVLTKSLVIAQVRVQFIRDGAWDSAFPPGPPPDVVLFHETGQCGTV